MVSKVSIAEIEVGKIVVKSRVRSVSAEAIQVLRQSYEDLDGFTTPIHVRRLRNGAYELIDGAHRLALATELGLTTILARIWECSSDQARFFETDANVSISHLTPLALARSLVVRQEAYLKLHPETAAGVAGALAKHGMQRNYSSFAEFVGAVMGVTPRQVRKIIHAGKSVSSEQAERLERAPKRVSINDLSELGKIGDAPERDRVIELLAEGKVKSAKDARRTWASENNRGVTPPMNNTEKTWLRLADAWKRAPKAGRVTFLEEHGDEVQALLDELRGGQV